MIGIRTTWKGTKNSVTINTNIETLHFEVQKATSCGLITNELVTNSMKYGFPDEQSGEILISLAETDDSTYQLTVHDTGVGFPNGDKAAENAQLGLTLVESLCRQMEGTLSMGNENGAKVKLIFP